MWNRDIESIKAWEREAKQTNMWKQKQNKRKKKLGILGSGLHTQEQACVRKARLCVRRFLPRNPKNIKNKAEPQNWNSNNLICILNIQTYKPKHVKAY